MQREQSKWSLVKFSLSRSFQVDCLLPPIATTHTTWVEVRSRWLKFSFAETKKKFWIISCVYWRTKTETEDAESSDERSGLDFREWIGVHHSREDDRRNLVRSGGQSNGNQRGKTFVNLFFSFVITVKLGFNKHAWDRPNSFIITGIFNNRVE